MSPKRDQNVEICELHPTMLGGDPSDPKNKIILSRADHFRYVRYWNGVVGKARKQLKTH